MLCFCIINNLIGQEVSEYLAIDIANNYYKKVQNDFPNDTNLQKIKKNLSRYYNRTAEKISPHGKANLWLVPVEDGWILISGNKKVAPILAHYQTTEKPQYDLLAPAEQFLLDWYEDEIAYANDSCEDCKIFGEWETLTQPLKATTYTSIVSPLLGNICWGQVGYQNSCDRRYNKFCPYVNNAELCYHAVAGCVAVAIAQIMWYWKWPYAAYIPTTVGGNYYDMHFYDWNLMPLSLNYSTPMNQVNMVAGFLRDCGYRLDMDYGESSSASDQDALYALKAFSYDDNSMSLMNKYNTSGWRDKLHADLDAGRPVYYSGQTQLIGGSGHAFVVDGYNSGDLYHINMGWADSTSNRYYNIDKIATNDSSHYKYLQSAIFGIKPAPYCYAQTFTTTGGYTKFDIVRGGNVTLSGMVIENVEYGQVFSSSQVRLTSGTEIRQGSNVHIAIKNVPCNTNTTSNISLEQPKTSEKVLARTAATASPENHSTFSIFPNPTTDIITVTSIYDFENISIFNMQGQQVLSSQSPTIDVSLLPIGIYILKAKTGRGNFIQEKFIKQ